MATVLHKSEMEHARNKWINASLSQIIHAHNPAFGAAILVYLLITD